MSAGARPIRVWEPPPQDDRETIRYEPGRLHVGVRHGVESLRRMGGVYASAGALVLVARTTSAQEERSRWTDSAGRPRTAVVAGTPYVAQLTRPVLKTRLSEAADWRKFVARTSEWKPCAPPDDVVGAVHGHRDEELPPLVGIASTPILRADGSIAAEEGYDAATGYYVALSETFAAVPTKPTQAQARTAYAELAEVFIDFPYTESAHASVGVAAILTVVARAAIRGSVPGFVFDASSGGVGKTLQTDAISLVTTGRAAARAAYPPDEDECAKVLASYAHRGTSLISIDDIKRPLGGENLDRVLTARDEVDFRILGSTRMVTMPWPAVLMFTGVNLSYLGQMARRVVLARLESRLERPQDRSDFRHADLVGWVRSERARLVVSALTVLRFYMAIGMPDAGCKRWGSFEEWSRLVPHAIVAAGGPDVLACRPPDDDDDMVPETVALRALLLGLDALGAELAPILTRSPEQGLTTAEISQALFHGQTPDERRPLKGAILELTRARREESPGVQSIGMALAKHKGRVLRVGHRLLRLAKMRVYNGSDRWVVEPTALEARPDQDGG